MGKYMLKDQRLKAIFDLLPECVVCADIGTDHGKLGCELLKTGKCREVWFTDISHDSLEKARHLAEEANLSSHAHFFEGDGAECLPGAPDAAVIAGMGAGTIIHILKNGMENLRGSTLILGANVDVSFLRRFLAENGFSIEDECAVTEGKKHYILIRAVPGVMQLTKEEEILGPILMRRKDPEVGIYAASRWNTIHKALESAGRSDTADTSEMEYELELWGRYL